MYLVVLCYDTMLADGLKVVDVISRVLNCLYDTSCGFAPFLKGFCSPEYVTMDGPITHHPEH